MSPQELSDAIIDFEVKNNVNDTALAFSSHLSVEKIHAMKSGEEKFTTEEAEQVLDYIQANS
ncbi:LBP_cg2779 family protein [uncultured Lactobacillus sp.]|uniref:LBP_cg2779 family protein n=1 Tax=uncultured Lactobacillus sp. TaxID=153152 RepID=UPI002610E97D|nr:LBP_cg2779 family protein [uncultured Lactobacillus sp.]